MSARTRLTIVDQALLSEDGPATKTEENSDVTNGNKLAIGPGITLIARNSTGVAKTITWTYDERGQTRTKVTNLAANEIAPLGPFEPALAVHTADAAENGFDVWLTANGVAGDVKFRAVRNPRL
jgi:hypothetical protein